MQVGGDNVQACATCHFRAGADSRAKNQVSPGLLRVEFGPDENGAPSAIPKPDHNFDGQGPNETLSLEDFPFRKLQDITNRESPIESDTNNVTSSAGVHYLIFGESGNPGPDPDGFYVGTGRRRGNVRRVEPRNTPTMINAVFNHRNFWDMRAKNLFNGRNPFGASDPDAILYKADDAPKPGARAGAHRQLEPRLAGGRATDEHHGDVVRRAHVPRRRPAPHAGAGAAPPLERASPPARAAPGSPARRPQRQRAGRA